MAKKDDKTISNIDEARVKRLTQKGHQSSMLEEYELLRLKIVYDKPMDKAEAIRFITLCRYFAKNGYSEAFRQSCSYLLDRYVNPYNL